ncbi:DUF5677 domain-containing protein [Nocardia asteroides]|uniref:DUF5677 domain-containing protein n=1 Tax=Nocardia asteroides TaxID=1824 RepID=UPI0034192955
MPTEPDTVKYLSTGRALIASFDEHLGASLRIKTDSEDAYVKAGIVLSLAIHAHKLGALTLDLLERDTPAALVVPTLRACFETALTVHWVAQSKDAALAVYNKDLKQRRALQKTLSDARSSTMQDIASRVAHTDLPTLSTSSDNQAKFFEQLVADFAAGGPDAYAYYRLLCAYTHPSASLSDQYLEESDQDSGEGTGAPFELRPDPRGPFPPTVCAHLVGCCLVWAGSAARYVQRDNTVRRSELRRVARELGTIADIQLADEAYLRQLWHR